MSVEFFIPLVVVGGPVLIVLMTLYYRRQQTEARYRTLLQLAEKGVTLPTDLLVERRITGSDRRRALVLIGCGIGLMAMFGALPFHFDNGMGVASLWGLGLLPLMIGAGYLANWLLNSRDAMRG